MGAEGVLVIEFCSGWQTSSETDSCNGFTTLWMYLKTI